MAYHARPGDFVGVMVALQRLGISSIPLNHHCADNKPSTPEPAERMKLSTVFSSTEEAFALGKSAYSRISNTRKGKKDWNKNFSITAYIVIIARKCKLEHGTSFNEFAKNIGFSSDFHYLERFHNGRDFSNARWPGLQDALRIFEKNDGFVEVDVHRLNDGGPAILVEPIQPQQAGDARCVLQNSNTEWDVDQEGNIIVTVKVTIKRNTPQHNEFLEKIADQVFTEDKNE